MTVAGDVTSLNNGAVWIARDGNPLALFVREADHAPGTGPAVGFSTFETLRINADGHVALLASLAGIPGAGESGITTFEQYGNLVRGRRRGPSTPGPRR